MNKEFYNKIYSLGIKSKNNESLKNYSTFKIGGIADLILFPKDEFEIIKFIELTKKSNEKYYIVGNGSNILFSDHGISIPIVCLGKNFSGIDMIDEVTMDIKAGTPLSSVCIYAAEHSLSGIEFAYGIPGTFGGAVYMNAGAYGGEISQVLSKCRFISKNGEISEKPSCDLELSYRHSIFENSGDVILSGTIKLKKGIHSEIDEKMKSFMKSRIEKQPLDYPSCGSTFKRPAGSFASKLIDESGLKGLSVGGAQVSTKHCGFIINTGDATFDDVISLISKVKEKVYDKTGFALQEEVRIVK